MKIREDAQNEWFCAREITSASMQDDRRCIGSNGLDLLVAGNYLFEASGKEVTVLTHEKFERDYTVVILWTRSPTEEVLRRSEEAYGFFWLANDERVLFCKRRERKIHTANGYAIYTDEKFLLRLGPMHWIEVTLAYNESAGYYYALDQAGQQLDFPANVQEAALHPRGHTCWGVWALPESA